MQLEIRLFAAAAEIAGKDRLQINIDNNDTVLVANVKAALSDQYPLLSALLERAFFARNGEYATMDTEVFATDELAVIPPVSGGSAQPLAETDEGGEQLGDVAIVKSPLSPAAMYEYVLDPTAGAIVIFSGTVREFTRGRQTLYLEYAAYDRMALSKMRELIHECQKKWPQLKMAIWHRVGVLQLTETSVLIGVSTPHRKNAFAAGEYAITTLKRTVPIWKKEYFADGQVEWVGPDGPWNPLGESGE